MPTLKEALALTPWRDQHGLVRPGETNALAPDVAAFRGGAVNAWQMDQTNELDVEFHLPHDWLFGSDIYIHLHWGHNLDPISGSNIVDIAATFAPRVTMIPSSVPYGIFTPEATGQFSNTGLNLTDYPQYCHVVNEILLGSSGAAVVGGETPLFDIDDWETDGLLLVNLKQTTAPTGGDSFIFTCDLHYQSDGSGTTSKDPDYDT